MNLSQSNQKNENPLHTAATNCSIRVAELLLSEGVDVNIKDIIHQIIKYYCKIPK